MKKLNSNYVMGTVGMIVTAFLHIVMALILKQDGSSIVFFSLYLMWMVFLTIGTVEMLTLKKKSVGRNK